MRSTSRPRIVTALIGLGSFFSGLKLIQTALSARSLTGITPAVGWLAVVMGVVCIVVAAFPRRWASERAGRREVGSIRAGNHLK